jgi:hypothetical protein
LCRYFRALAEGRGHVSFSLTRSGDFCKITAKSEIEWHNGAYATRERQPQGPPGPRMNLLSALAALPPWWEGEIRKDRGAFSFLYVRTPPTYQIRNTFRICRPPIPTANPDRQVDS